MAQPFLTASDLRLFGTDSTDSDSNTARSGARARTGQTFARWFIGTFALTMTGLTFALIVVGSAPNF